MLDCIALVAALTFVAATGPVPDLVLSPTPTELGGYEGSCRTAWFAADGQHVYCDYGHIVKWHMATRAVVSKTRIPGYQTHASFTTSDGTLWMQGNVAYDSPAAPEIARAHPNLNRAALDGPVSSRPTGDMAVGIGAFVPGTRSAFVVVSRAGTYEVRQLDADTGELGATFFHEKRHGRSVPAAIAVSPDGARLAIGLAGKKKNGVLLYDLPSTSPRFLKTGGEVNAVAFAAGAVFAGAYDGRLYRWSLQGGEASPIASPVKVSAMAVHPSGSHAAVAGPGGAYLVDLEGRAEPVRLSRSRVFGLTFSDDGRRLAVALSKRLRDPRVPSLLLFDTL